MGVANYFKIRKDAFNLRTVDINTTYTVRTGRSADGHHIDRVITITDPTANFTIAVPAGAYEGEELLITLVAHATAAVECTIDLAVGTDVVLGDLGDYTSLEWVNATAGWVPLSAVTD